MIFSWQIKQWQSLQQAHEHQRLPHALLFAGMAGTGKAIFAERFSRWLLCETAQKNKLTQACAECHACRLSETRVHPNLLWIEPEKAGAAIKVTKCVMFLILLINLLCKVIFVLSLFILLIT